MPILRALTRLTSPQHRRQAQAHRYVVRLRKLIADDEAPPQAKTRAQSALTALPKVPGFSDLVPDIDAPWTPDYERAALYAEWGRATQNTRRPVPPPAPGPDYLPPAMRLKHKWAVALAARYHCTTFPILHRPVPREGPRTRRGTRPRPLYEKAVTTHAENAALATLPLLHRPSCTAKDLRDITTALRTLRPREHWACRPPATA